MKASKRRFVIFAGLLLMTAGMILSASFSQAASPSYLQDHDRILVSVLPAASQPQMQLTKNDIEGIADTLKAPVTWWGTRRSEITTEKKEIAADPIP